MSELFKLQWPLTPGDMVLGHNESGSKTFRMPLDRKLQKLFRNGRRPNVFVLADIVQNNLLYEPVAQPDPGW